MGNNVTNWNLQFASGLYLTHELPLEMLDARGTDKGLKEVDDFIVKHLTDLTEFCEPDYIWDLIECTARSIQKNYRLRVPTVGANNNCNKGVTDDSARD